MIWNPSQFGAIESAASVEGIATELNLKCGPALSGLDEVLVDVAAAVEAMLAEQDAGPDCDSVMLVELAARALHAIGEERAARRLCLLRSGIIRPAVSSMAGNDPLWILDLRPLAVRAGVMIELELVASVDLVLECLGDVWDKSGGRGILGLWHAPCAPIPLGKRNAGSMSATEIRAACAARLRAIGARRGWWTQPEILDLDWNHEERRRPR